MLLRDLQCQFGAELRSGQQLQVAQLIEQRGFEASQRVSIYRNNIDAALTDNLANIFPVSRAIVGDEFFRQMARSYTRAHPSETGNLGDCGEHLPAFMQTMPELDCLPYLPDIARIDWDCHSSFHAEYAPVLNIDSLNSFSPDDYEHLLFTLHPAVRAVKSEFPIFDIWEFATSNDSSRTVPDIHSGGQQVLICRRDHAVKVVNVQTDFINLIDQIGRRRPLGETISAILKLHPEYNLQEGLNRLFSFGAVASVTIDRHQGLQ